MLKWWQVWLWLSLDGVKDMLVLAIIIFVGAIFIFILYCWIDDYEEGKAFLMKWYFGIVPAFIFLIFVAVAVPSSKDLALIYVLPKIVNNEKVQKLPEKMLDVANKKLDEILEIKSEVSK